MSLRGPNPMRSAPSSAPLEAMVAKKQAHIEELVAQNRTLEHTINKLRQTITEEQERGKVAIAKLQQQRKAEHAEWREGCDSLQAAHRIAHLRTAIELDKERTAALRERDQTRKERLARLQRDYRLTTFQRREVELEGRASQFEHELEDAREAHAEKIASISRQLEGKAGALEARCTGLAEQLRETAGQLATTLKERTQAEEELAKLRTDKTNLLASSDTVTATLERTRLQLEGVESARADLETKFAESERTVTDLRRQLDKWRTLESREGAEVEALRRGRIELEVRVKELEGRLEDAEKSIEEKDAAVAKLVSRLKSWKTSVEEHQAALRDTEDTLQEVEKELEEAKAELETSRGKIQQLQSQLTAAKVAAREVSGSPSHTSKKADGSHARRSESAEPQSVPPSPTQQRPKPHSKFKPAMVAPSISAQNANHEESSEEVREVLQLKKSKKAVGPEAKKRAAEPPDDDGKEDEDVELVAQSPPPDKRRKKGKRKATDQDAEPPKKKSIVDKKGKRKASVMEDEDDEPEQAPKKRGRKKSGQKTEGDGDVATSRKAKPRSRTESLKSDLQTESAVCAPSKVQEEARADAEEEIQVTAGPRKKRKLPMFPTAQPSSFAWDQLLQTGSGGLNIPTVLSPVKESDTVSARPRPVFGKTGSSVLGSIGSSLASRR